MTVSQFFSKYRGGLKVNIRFSPCHQPSQSGLLTLVPFSLVSLLSDGSVCSDSLSWNKNKEQYDASVVWSMNKNPPSVQFEFSCSLIFLFTLLHFRFHVNSVFKIMKSLAVTKSIRGLQQMDSKTLHHQSVLSCCPLIQLTNKQTTMPKPQRIPKFVESFK